MAAKTKSRNGRTVKKKAAGRAPLALSREARRPCTGRVSSAAKRWARAGRNSLSPARMPRRGAGGLGRGSSGRARGNSVVDRDGFVFTTELTKGRPAISDAEMLATLREFGKVVGGRPFAQWEFNAWKGRRCCALAIARRFVNWWRALAAAGIEGGQARGYEPEELMVRFERAWRRLGRRPSMKTLPRFGDVSVKPYLRQWGSLARVGELLVKYKAGRITRETLLAGGGRSVRRSLPPGVRWDVFVRDGHRCGGCGRSAREKGVRLEVDHIVPVSRGGTDEMGNLRALCWECNRGKGGRGEGGRKGR